MTRPAVIRRFERLYLASTLAWLAAVALSWDARRKMIAGSSALAGYEWLVPAGFALVVLVSLALWWQAAHRRSIMARTGIAGMAAVSAIVIVLTLIGMVMGRALSPASTLLQLASSSLDIAAAAALFRADAREWFGEPAGDERPS